MGLKLGEIKGAEWPSFSFYPLVFEAYAIPAATIPPNNF
jgi:hypothetical protein